MEELYALAYCNRGLKRQRLTKAAPRPGRGVSFASGRGNTHAFHAIERAGVDEGLRQARIQKGSTFKLQSS